MYGTGSENTDVRQGQVDLCLVDKQKETLVIDLSCKALLHDHMHT